MIQGCDRYSYRDPHLMYHEGWFHLWMTVNEPRREGRSMVSFLGQTKSRDLRNWQPVQMISQEHPLGNYSSPGNVIRYGNQWLLCFQSYPIPGDGFIGDNTARLFVMRSQDLIAWSQPELLRVKGPDIPVEKMGRMIDPYLFEDKDEPGKWWCTYKQDGVSMPWTRDFQQWRYHGRTDAGRSRRKPDCPTPLTSMGGLKAILLRAVSLRSETLPFSRVADARGTAVNWADHFDV